MQNRLSSVPRGTRLGMVGKVLGISLLAVLAGLGCSTEAREFGGGAGGGTSTSTSTATSTSTSTSTATTTSTGVGGQGGSGGGCQGAGDCDDSDACTDDSCNAGACDHTAVAVDDGNPCTVDTCDALSGVSNTPDPTIDDGDACTVDACDTTTGTITHDPAVIDDQDACTDDSCDPAVGVINVPTVIDDMDACTADSCDVLLGVAHDPIDPNDSNACTTDSCDVMLGVQNVVIDPNDSNACTTDSCDMVLGVLNVAVDPNDNNACTTDSCDPTLGIQNVAVDPNDNDACTTDSCDVLTGIKNAPIAIPSDNSLCTTDTCNPANGQFVYVAVPVDDGDGCTTDSCKPQTGSISHLPVAVPTDSNPCTLDRCTSVNNAPTYTYPASTVLFTDDFANNAKGWTLGTEWAIGSALASTGGSFGNDPAQDHTTTSDNGVAGVVLGGNHSSAIHGFYYLESPVINAVVPNGEVVLSFYRWLNSDYQPYVHNTVDVYNGSAWVNLWTSPGFPEVKDQPPAGNGWTLVQYALTPYVNANMKIRFGFDTASGNGASGGWNIDDVTIENRPFPTDGNLCTADTCNALTGGGTFTTIAVTDNDACTTDTCDSTRSFTHAYTAGNTKIFTEPFANNNNLWTLGTEWAIGPTVQGSGFISTGYQDPPFDFTNDTTDNGVAGVVLGGTASIAVHPAYYLTSPAKSTALQIGKKLYLSFDRWLNTDYPNYMTSTVEVYNGSAWSTIYTAVSPGVFDSSWVFQQFDISAYANPNLQVRFGVAVGSSGVYTISSWNVDNFRLDYCP